MYYVLALRKLDDPQGAVQAIARAESEQALWDYIELCSVQPTYRMIDGRRTFCVYGSDTALADYSPPNPLNSDEGVIYFGKIDDKVDEILAAMRHEVEQKILNARAEIERNTFLV